MHSKLNLSEIQKKTGHIFKNPSLAEKAFASGSPDSKNLAFLGRNLITAVISEYIYTHTPPGIAANPEKDLRFYQNSLNTGDFTSLKKLSQSDDTATADEKTQEDSELFYAVSAAIYLDSGLTALKNFAIPLIRAVDSDSHYEKSTEGKIVMSDDLNENEASDGKIHIQNARRGRKSGVTSLGITRAATVGKKSQSDNSEKNQRASQTVISQKDRDSHSEEDSRSRVKEKTSGIAGILSFASRKRNTNYSESSGSENDSKQEQTAPTRRFIRDALAPVRLSDELRNAGYSRPPRSAKNSESEKKEPEQLNENYKSMLQEAVQKIIRTSNVILNYNTSSDRKGGYNCVISAQDRQIASASSPVRKTAEQLAAKNAYNALLDKSGPEYSFLSELSKSGSLSSDGPDDFVSKVNRYFQKNHKNSKLPVYLKKDSDSKKTYRIAVMFEGKELAEATAPSLKQAKQLAAEKVCRQLGIN